MIVYLKTFFFFILVVLCARKHTSYTHRLHCDQLDVLCEINNRKYWTNLKAERFYFTFMFMHYLHAVLNFHISPKKKKNEAKENWNGRRRKNKHFELQRIWLSFRKWSLRHFNFSNQIDWTYANSWKCAALTVVVIVGCYNFWTAALVTGKDNIITSKMWFTDIYAHNIQTYTRKPSILTVQLKMFCSIENWFGALVVCYLCCCCHYCCYYCLSLFIFIRNALECIPQMRIKRRLNVEMPLPGCVLMDPCIAMNFRKKKITLLPFESGWVRARTRSLCIRISVWIVCSCCYKFEMWFFFIVNRIQTSIHKTVNPHFESRQDLLQFTMKENKTKIHRSSTRIKWTITIRVLFVTISIYILLNR